MCPAQFKVFTSINSFNQCKNSTMWEISSLPFMEKESEALKVNLSKITQLQSPHSHPLDYVCLLLGSLGNPLRFLSHLLPWHRVTSQSCHGECVYVPEELSNSANPMKPIQHLPGLEAGVDFTWCGSQDSPHCSSVPRRRYTDAGYGLEHYWPAMQDGIFCAMSKKLDTLAPALCPFESLTLFSDCAHISG